MFFLTKFLFFDVDYYIFLVGLFFQFYKQAFYKVVVVLSIHAASLYLNELRPGEQMERLTNSCHDLQKQF